MKEPDQTPTLAERLRAARDINQAAERLAYASDADIIEISTRDPDMIRDIAKARLETVKRLRACPLCRNTDPECELCGGTPP